MVNSERKSIWLDCDTGHDDAYAILLAAYHPSSRLIGVSTVHGNSAVENTTANTRAILEAIGRSDIPVVKGEATPLSRPPLYAPQYHGEDGLGGVTLLPKAKTPEGGGDAEKQGIEEIYRLLMKQPEGSVLIVPTGPLTNVAKLIIQFPHVLTRIRGVSVMGGGIGDGFSDAPSHRKDGPGNSTPFAEFNILCDPEAANAVFSSVGLANKITLATLDVTHHCRATSEVINRLSGQSTLRRMMLEVLTFFAETYKIHAGMADGPPLHDPCAVFAVLEPEKFDDRNGERWNVAVPLSGEQLGRTSITPSEPGEQQVRIPRGMDVASFWSSIEGCLNKAELASKLA